MMSEGMNSAGKMSQGNRSRRRKGVVGLKRCGAVEGDAREKGTNERKSNDDETGIVTMREGRAL